MDQGTFREVSSSNTREIISGSPAARRKMDFEDDIDGFGVRLPPPSATQKLRLQTESPSNRNSGSPAARRYKKDDRMDGVGAAKTLYPPPHYDLQ